MYIPSPIEYLEAQEIDFILVPHMTSFTAQDAASKAHIKGNLLSKVVVMSKQNKLLMLVIPANCIVQQSAIARLLSSPSVKIVHEHQFRDRFPECEIGAMPPFGNLYGMDVLVAAELVQQNAMTFNGGTHNQLIKMRTSDFMRLTGARSISVGYKLAAIAHPIIAKQPKTLLYRDDWQG